MIEKTLTQIHDEKRTISIRLRQMKERAVAFPSLSELFEEQTRELQAYLDKILLDEKRLLQQPLVFEQRGESDSAPVKFTMMMPMGIA